MQFEVNAFPNLCTQQVLHYDQPRGQWPARLRRRAASHVWWHEAGSCGDRPVHHRPLSQPKESHSSTWHHLPGHPAQPLPAQILPAADWRVSVGYSLKYLGSSWVWTVASAQAICCRLPWDADVKSLWPYFPPNHGLAWVLWPSVTHPRTQKTCTGCRASAPFNIRTTRCV